MIKLKRRRNLTFSKNAQKQLTREAATAVVRDTRVVAAFAEVCKFEQDADTVRESLKSFFLNV